MIKYEKVKNINREGEAFNVVEEMTSRGFKVR